MLWVTRECVMINGVMIVQGYFGTRGIMKKGKQRDRAAQKSFEGGPAAGRRGGLGKMLASDHPDTSAFINARTRFLDLSSLSSSIIERVKLKLLDFQCVFVEADDYSKPAR